jgi:hypothetical protein
MEDIVDLQPLIQYGSFNPLFEGCLQSLSN